MFTSQSNKNKTLTIYNRPTYNTTKPTKLFQVVVLLINLVLCGWSHGWESRLRFALLPMAMRYFHTKHAYTLYVALDLVMLLDLSWLSLLKWKEHVLCSCSFLFSRVSLSHIYLLCCILQLSMHLVCFHFCSLWMYEIYSFLKLLTLSSLQICVVDGMPK